MQAWNFKCCHIKLWIKIKELSVSQAFNIICILVYCILYTMTIDVTLRIIKKLCIWSLHLRNFLCLPVFAIFPQKLRRLSGTSSNIIYTYLKLKLGTEKHIRLKWVILPQWSETRIIKENVPTNCYQSLILNYLLWIGHISEIPSTTRPLG